MNKWNPSQDQQSGSISRTFDFFVERLSELQDELDCPDESIYDFLEVIRNRWLSDATRLFDSYESVSDSKLKYVKIFAKEDIWPAFKKLLGKRLVEG